MYLKDYFQNINKSLGETFFSGISSNSASVKKNSIFFAIRGNRFDGNDYIEDAIKKGAKIIFSEKKIKEKKKDITYIKSSNLRKLLSKVSYRILNIKFKKLVAVTGTNGKSSVADFYHQILFLNSKKVASIGTIGVKIKDKKKTLDNTTLDPIKLSKIFKDLKKRKIDYVILEASSHGLKQNRLDGLLFDIGIFTNLSHDHLDYHKSMSDYLSSKLYLFKKLIRKNGVSITDESIPQFKKIKKISLQKGINLNLIFNKKKGLDLISHKFNNEKQIIEIKFKNKKYTLILNLIGKIQIKNVLMSILAAYKSHINFKNIVKIIHKIKPVEGRLEKIGNIKNNSKVILDYAHTPEALKLALSNLKEQFPESKLSLVFGCGGNRDFKKRSKMGKIADKYADKIYLTDDNPRNESPSKIRKDIKKGIKKNIEEIPNRKTAIHKSIQKLNTGDILLVAGKGHEKYQDYGIKRLFFSDKEIILDSIKYKNKFLSKNLKLNIIKEKIDTPLSNNLIIKDASINSKTIKKNDIFIAIKGKKIDGNKFVSEALRKKSSLAIVNKIDKNAPTSKQIKVKNPLNFLTTCSSILRQNLDTKIISITGSCGKTTLKEMIGSILKQISRTTISPKSYNNKYGVPLSLFNLKFNDNFGVFEVGMDKKGEIDNLSNIIKPDIGIITNVSYAHSKNFKTINHIADAKAEIMNNIKPNGIIVLNCDDTFFYYHNKIAIKKKLKVLSFGIKNRKSFTKLIKIKKNNNNRYELFIKIDNNIYSFYSKNYNKNNILNILASLTTLYSFSDIKKLKKDIFLNFETPLGRGDISNLKIKGKIIHFVDESYNSNPLSVRVALENFDKIITKKRNKKYLILGDMLELGKHSIKQHKMLSNDINKTNINKVYVVGKYIKETFSGLKQNKKGKILSNNFDITNFIIKNFKNNDYLMIKGSNATGLNKIANILKQGSSNVV